MDWISEGLNNLDYVHVLLAGVVAMAVGYLWYSDWLFGKRWRKESGVDMEGAADEMGRMFLMGYLTNLVSVSVLYAVILASGTTELVDAIWLAVVLGVGFNTAALFMNNLYQRKSPMLSAIDSGYQVAALVAAAATFTYLM